MKVILNIVILLSIIFPPVASGQEEILIGLIPEENIFRQMDRHRPLAFYLSRKLGINVKLTILSRYGDILDSFVSRGMDGAFFGVFTSFLAMERLGVEPVARPVNLDGSSTSQAYVFVRKDSGINGIKDMKGKRIAFVDRATATGYLYLLALLREKGISDFNNFFSEYYFTGSHDASIHAVMDNRADIGIAKGRIFRKLSEKDPLIKNELVILFRSPEFPDTTLCLKKEMPESLKKRIKDILLNMDKDRDAAEVLRALGAVRFVPATRDDFKEIFHIAKKAGIDIKNYRYR